MRVDLSGRAALVTGGGRGIGRAVAEALASRGARVAVHYHRDEEAARAVCQSLPGSGHVILRASLGNPGEALDLPVRAAEQLGRLDILVNNAGIYEPHSIADLSEEAWLKAWSRALDVNLTGAAHVCRGAVEPLTAAGGGHIVNITSRGAFRGEPEAPAYGASKAGLNSLSQSLALALGPRNIKVVAVAPGWVLTDMTREYLEGPEGSGIRGQSPLDRTTTVEEVAEVVLLAVSGRADALTGAVLDVNAASHLR